MVAATLACAPGGCGFEQDCSVCERDPDARARWGCDAPAPEPYAWLEPCPHCNGRGPCAMCENAGRLPLHRCPRKMAGGAELDFIAMASMVELGVLPDPGGWQDQPMAFAQAFPTTMREIQHWRGVAMKQAQDKARRQAPSNQRGRR